MALTFSEFEGAGVGQENFSEMRKAMVVSQLRTTDVSDPRIIAAMSEVPREAFVPEASRALAYCDRGVSLGEERMLNPPLATGLLLNAAQITSDDNVLLIGAATGYTAAVVARLAGSVVALEQSAKLISKAKANLEGLDNVKIEKGDLASGSKLSAPYDVILIDGVVEQVPEELNDQLRDGGRLIAAIREKSVSRLALGTKAGGVIGYRYFADCDGCSLPGFDRPEGFNF